MTQHTKEPWGSGGDPIKGKHFPPEHKFHLIWAGGRGHNVAAVYSSKDVPIIKAAPTMQAEIARLRQDKAELVEVVEDELEYLLDEKQGDEMVQEQLALRIIKHKAAIAKAGEGS